MMHQGVTSWVLASSLISATAFHDRIAVEELCCHHKAYRKRKQRKHRKHRVTAPASIAFPKHRIKLIGVHGFQRYRMSIIQSMPFASAMGVTNG